MVDSGWQLQNTIPDELFNAETQELTHAGEMKVQWILTQMPARRRAVFVLRGSTPEITETRVKSVEKAAAGVVRRHRHSDQRDGHHPARRFGILLRADNHSYESSSHRPVCRISIGSRKRAGAAVSLRSRGANISRSPWP